MPDPADPPADMPLHSPPGTLADTPARQHWDPDRYCANAGFVAVLGEPVLDLLAPRAGERILDLGCGDGVLTAKLAGLGVDVIGVDASVEQVAAARARGLDARAVDGHALAFTAAFDAVFSNAALHWMTDPDAVLAGVRRALRPGGRFVGEFGGYGNCARIRAALYDGLARRGVDAAALDPWYFPTPEAYRERLEAQGFTVRSLALIDRPTPLPGPLAAWLDTFGDAFFGVVPAAERPQFRTWISERLRPLLCDAEGQWTADYVRLRFAASLTA